MLLLFWKLELNRRTTFFWDINFVGICYRITCVKFRILLVLIMSFPSFYLVKCYGNYNFGRAVITFKASWDTAKFKIIGIL